jgi:hypothetical protein
MLDPEPGKTFEKHQTLKSMALNARLRKPGIFPDS